jgi:hypothetical protein
MSHFIETGEQHGVTGSTRLRCLLSPIREEEQTMDKVCALDESVIRLLLRSEKIQSEVIDWLLDALLIYTTESISVSSR